MPLKIFTARAHTIYPRTWLEEQGIQRSLKVLCAMYRSEIANYGCVLSPAQPQSAVMVGWARLICRRP